MTKVLAPSINLCYHVIHLQELSLLKCLPVALLLYWFCKTRHLIDIIWQLFLRSLSISNAFLTQYLHNKPIMLHSSNSQISLVVRTFCLIVWKRQKTFSLNDFLENKKKRVGKKKWKMTSNNKKIEKVFLHKQLRKCKCLRNWT